MFNNERINQMFGKKKEQKINVANKENERLNALLKKKKELDDEIPF